MEYINDDDDSMMNGLLINFSSLFVIPLFPIQYRVLSDRCYEQQGGPLFRLSNRIISFFFCSFEQVYSWIVSLDSVVVCVYIQWYKKCTTNADEVDVDI